MIDIGWPEGIIIGLSVIKLLMAAANHGEEEPAEKYNFPLSFMSAIITGVLLYWGGFFS